MTVETMTMSMAGATMAKKRGRPKAENPKEGKQIRLDPELVAMATTVANRRGMKVGPWLSELMSPHVRREYAKLLRELKDLEDEIQGAGE